MVFLLISWGCALRLIYPIAWGVSEGGNQITSDGEQAFYAVLDTFSQGIFVYMLVGMTSSLDFDRLGLGYSEYGRVRDGQVFNEKHTAAAAHGANPANGAGGYSNGATGGVVTGPGNGVNPQTSAV